ncbi:hypothetical protein [Anaerosphaera multitolerans]|uniref:Uncharacterized protein n=1 Tax=Anaerosphaera multitolerans TaxID=2487351 RepID=A0A437S5H8_9FIRM|nr:hypothetical protein [Anaerosphaera multitolerans]RVU54283.1 hypothetical protein EF514_08255 [Anaerosphaera multitolerans]
MAKKKNKKIKSVNLDKVVLSEEETKVAKKKAMLIILLCIMWPITLLLLWPSLRSIVPTIVYYGIILISMVNVILTYTFTTLEIDEMKYQAFLQRNPIGKVERLGSVFVIAEVGLIMMFIILSK